MGLVISPNLQTRAYGACERPPVSPDFRVPPTSKHLAPSLGEGGSIELVEPSPLPATGLLYCHYCYLTLLAPPTAIFYKPLFNCVWYALCKFACLVSVSQTNRQTAASCYHAKMAMMRMRKL